MRADFFISACINLGLVTQHTLPSIIIYVLYAYFFSDLKPDLFFIAIGVAALVTALLSSYEPDTKRVERMAYIPTIITTCVISFALDAVGPVFVVSHAGERGLIPLYIISAIWDYFWLPNVKYAIVKTVLLGAIRIVISNDAAPFWVCVLMTACVLISDRIAKYMK